MTAIPVPEFIEEIEADLINGGYEWLHPITADYLELLQQIRVAAGEGDRGDLLHLLKQVQVPIAKAREKRVGQTGRIRDRGDCDLAAPIGPVAGPCRRRGQRP